MNRSSSIGFSMVIAVLFIAFAAAPGLAAEPTLDEIVNTIDRLYRADSSFAELQMTVVTPNWERTMKLKMWGEGLKKTFITITSPAKEKGTATLRIGNEMWNFFPKINKVMKVPPSMMMGSWMGSDFNNDDLVKETSLMEDYSAELYRPENARDDEYYIKLMPKEQTVSVWGKVVAVVRKGDLMPVRQEYYDEKGKLMRTMNFSEIKKMGGKMIPTLMELIPVNKKGNKTVIKYISAEFNKKIDKNIFSLRNLKKLR